MSRDMFLPRWASPPGQTIRDALHARDISIGDLAASIGLSPTTAEELLAGTHPITVGLAQRLAQSLGGSVGFWLARDAQYRDDLMLMQLDQWAGAFPLGDMASFGWIQKSRTWNERIEAALSFFGVANLDQWQEAYGLLVEHARYRRSTAIVADRAAIAAWLRRAEIEGQGLAVARWDPNAFRTVLQEVRSLSLERDPQRFVPALVDSCARVGVAAVVVRAPRGCPLSGAAWFRRDGTPQIGLTARYLSDDHFWFSFYHEAAHLLLHSPGLFIDDLERHAGPGMTPDEAQADEFAADVLLPPDLRSELGRGRITPLRIARLARAARVSRGVIVGQLQHHGYLPFRTRYNSFKHRYQWHGTTLEKA